ncbi:MULTISPECIES: 2-oxoacid:acceptor oxidoreductase subunit alpha [Hydrogenibacillus]|uniref:2-oxoglutarate oxidoreductase, alpha subunit n=1 Tax=Hydrogenibacillus schlegelii TaxID=1484 RepID=A0A2T5GC84_HYDSH|nr:MULTISPECIES: 2-oxoacid:acceptor oxidoreductase subunit alpha [Hydrogenibacillus]PTQ53792.1 MAG: 2-oxoglutarate oxidoreductase, alpha subunit [Hydrogenibacillus schlegelii]
METIRTLEWKVGGQQGEGIDSTGEIFARTLFRYGYYVTTYKQFMSRIKGGHTNYKLRATPYPTQHAGDFVDILLALDDETIPVNRHELRPGAIVIQEGKETAIREEDGYLLAVFPLKAIATELGNPLAKNMIALGMSGALVSLPVEEFYAFIEKQFEKKGEKVIASNKAAVDKGYALVREHLADRMKRLEPLPRSTERLYISGNEATAFGSFMAGCRFLSAYPITPASEIMEWMAAHLPAVGGTILQVEDEIAGITFAVGAAYAGARAMTSTSGPGMSLKTEALGMAAMSETPIVIVDSQRAGPSTGLPTKHEQSDLFHMLFATHGEIPRIVVYPSSIEDAFYVAAEAFNLAERYQTPVILALDLVLSMNRTTIPRIDAKRVPIDRGKIVTPEEAKKYGEFIFKRYRFTEDGISPRALPGNPYGVHTASSNEHGEDGYITEDPVIRTKIMQKRMEKVKTARLSRPFYVQDGEADVMLVGVGSARGVIEEVARRLREDDGVTVGGLFIQQLKPLPVEELRPYLAGKRMIITVENNYSGQLLQWLRQHFPIHDRSTAITQYDGNPFRVTRVAGEVKEVLDRVRRAQEAHA